MDIAGWPGHIANPSKNLQKFLPRRAQKCLTFLWTGAIITEHTTRNPCSCGGIGRRTGLKIRRINLRAGSSPATSTTIWVQRTASISYRGVEQLVACRAHNPKVAGSNPASATRSKTVKRLVLTVFAFINFHITWFVMIMVKCF